MKIKQLFKDILECRSGATAIEYGLIASLIVIGMVGALNSFAGQVIAMWGTVETTVAAAR